MTENEADIVISLVRCSHTTSSAARWQAIRLFNELESATDNVRVRLRERIRLTIAEGPSPYHGTLRRSRLNKIENTW